MTTPNEKPSERAARVLLNSGKLIRTIHEVKAMDNSESAEIIARETSCDHLQSQFDEANRQIAQLETEKQLLTAENARLRAVLEKIVQNWKDDEPHCDSVSLAMKELKK